MSFLHSDRFFCNLGYSSMSDEFDLDKSRQTCEVEQKGETNIKGAERIIVTKRTLMEMSDFRGTGLYS